MKYGTLLGLAIDLMAALPAIAQEPADARIEPAVASIQSAPAAAAETAPSDGCFLHARPAPACRFFGVTEFGVSFGAQAGLTAPANSGVFVLPGNEVTHLTSRVIGNLGVMRNLSTHDAIGVSWFVTTDEVGRTGPAIHYRRWLKGRQSLDFSVGVPVAVSDPVGARASFLGLVKYNPVPWMGIAVRPEVVHLQVAYVCTTPTCAGITDTTRRVLVGIEFSDKPGAIVSAIAWGFAGLTAALLKGGS